MYDFYPDDWRGPEPFEPLLDAPDDVGVSPTPTVLPVLTEDEIRAFLIRVARNERYPEKTRHSAHALLKRRTPSVKALSHRETLQEIRDDPETRASTRIKAGRLIVRRGAVRTEDLRGL